MRRLALLLPLLALALLAWRLARRAPSDASGLRRADQFDWAPSSDAREAPERAVPRPSQPAAARNADVRAPERSAVPSPGTVARGDASSALWRLAVGDGNPR